MKSFIFVIILLLTPFAPVQGLINITNSDFSFTDFNLNVTTPSVLVDSFVMNGTGFTTQRSEDLRYYEFDNATSVFDVRWINQTSAFANFTITDVVTDVRGIVSGTELGSVELDQVSTTWSYVISNIIEIGNAVQVEYFFPVPPIPIFNAIIISLNSPEFDRLGGVFSLICPANSTLTGLLTNGTFVCTDLDDFFP